MEEAHIRRLWRHRGTTLPTPRRGPRQQLDLDEILAAGIALADEGGLAAVSTRAVAARFGKTAMALYPYVGTKDQLLALMQDQAVAMPAWTDPPLPVDALSAWAFALYDVYLAHPWLTELPWSQAGQGPNEQDWLERLLGIRADAAAVTMLYATVRAAAQTDAAYRRLDPAGWLARASETRRLIPDLAQRYPLSTSLAPLTPDWREAPRAAVAGAVRLIAYSASSS